jgi:hypothetical protein
MEKYELERVHVACPVCRSLDGLRLYSVNSNQASQHFVLREAAPDRHRLLREHIEALWGQTTCDVVRCAGCGFCFADPFVAGDARFYGLAYERSGYPQWKWEYQRTRDALLELNGRKRLDHARLLEVGAGNGAFIKQVTPDLIRKDQVLCTEFSEFGRNAIAQLGVKCISQDVRELSASGSDGRFDFICMFQVLEHLDRLDDLFVHLSSLATDSAHLFVAVPNGERIEFNELNGALLDLPPNHVGRWNRQSFEVMAQRHRWQVVEHEVQREGPRAKAQRFAFYRYGYKSQSPDSLANRIEKIPRKSLRRPLQALAVGWYLLGGLSPLISLLCNPELGESQWAHLVKPSA